MAGEKAASRYVAFLRGINVGGHRVKMEHLRDLFEALGFSEVATFIASGNVAFATPDADAEEIGRRIEAHLKGALGYEVATFLRTPGELAAVAAFQPFEDAGAEAPGSTLHVGFLREAPGVEAARKLLAMRTEMDDFRIQGREWYWLCRGKVTGSLVPWPLVAKTLQIPSTMRNVTTVRKLAARYSPG